MNVFMTGATGFVGRHVLDALKNTDNRVLVLTRQNIELDFEEVLSGDLNNLEVLKPRILEFCPDVVIHLAWEGIPDYSESLSRANLYNSINLLEYIINNASCKKILVSGSCWEYGKKIGICKESDPVNIDSYFTWAKHSLYQYLSVKCSENNVVLNWFRNFYVYGPGQRKGSLIPMLINSIGVKETPKIKSPLNKNDFVYVEDVARAFSVAFDANLPSGVYNLGSGNVTSVYEIYRMVEMNLLGTETLSKQALGNGQKVETVNFWADMEKTEHALNMSCKTSMREGIKKLIQSMHLRSVG